jgi:DNA-binding winged helix-turn-helix (wHTH) protein
MSTAHRIDVHLHVVPPFWAKALPAYGGDPSGPRSGDASNTVLPPWSPDSAIDFMDSQQIAAAILSLAAPGITGWDNGGRREMARRINEYTADLVAKRPDRFGHFATLPLPDVDRAPQDVRRPEATNSGGSSMANSKTIPRESTFADSRTTKRSFASIHRINSSTKPGQRPITVPGTQMSRTSGNDAQTAAALPADLGGLEEAVIHSLLSVLEKIVDRMHGSSTRNDDPSKQSLAIAEPNSSIEPLVRPPAETRETMLRVGSLELDLIDRTAKRGDRLIKLGPCEFRLLKYMMQRSGQLLTRAQLLEDVWLYKFVPQTNLVDVHMGKLRRKVDGSKEAPMIRNVRGAGFIIHSHCDPMNLHALFLPGRVSSRACAGEPRQLKKEFDPNLMVG